MRVDFGNQSLTIHKPFHQSTAYERGLFGAMGSGKTYAAVDEAIAWCLEQPGIRGLMCRKTAPELRDTTEPVFKERLPAELWMAGEERRSGGHMESFTFPNGSKLLFRSLDDWNKHRSLNLGFIVYDEASEIDEETYMGMEFRVRQREPTAEARQRGYTGEITRRGIWLATNPNGHDWLWERFNPDGHVPNWNREGTQAFRSTTLDNPYLPEGFVRNVLNMPEVWVKRYVLCQFDDFAGKIFEDWNWDDHVVDPIDLRSSNVYWMGMDPGTRSPTAALWVYLDLETRTLIGVADYENAYTAAEKHAVEWRKIEAKLKGTVRRRIADPNSITQTERASNNTLGDIYRRAGFNFELGPSQDKHRIPALAQMIYQRRFKVTRDCLRTYESIKEARWEDLTPAARLKGIDAPEKRLKKNDHLENCAEYICGRWVAPPKLKVPETDYPEHLHVARREHEWVWATARKRHRRKRRPGVLYT